MSRESQLQLLALAQKQLLAAELQEAFSPEDTNSRPTDEQDEAFRAMATHTFLDVSGGNQSGKSQWGSRNIAYFCQRNHPYVDIDAKWPNQRILSLLLAQSTKLYEEHWESRIRPFFDKNDYKERMQGGILQSVNFKNFNTKLLFFSYENPLKARDRVQGFTGHLILIDELCQLVDLYEESERRVQKNGGNVLATYTQKVRAPLTRSYLKSPSPYKAHFVFDAFKNPAYDEEKKARIEASLAQFPPDIRELKRRQILLGDYEDESEFAYDYDKERNGCPWPENYSREWRHIEVVDPAASGKLGWLVLAEDPDRDVIDHEGKTRAVWYVIDSKYIPGEAPSTLVEKVSEESAPYRLVDRISDPHETWYIKEARKKGLHYRKVRKDDRKVELIKGPSQAFLDGWLKVVDAGNQENESLIQELGEAIWKPDGSGIKNSSKYHLLDCLQYGTDMVPNRDFSSEPMTPNQVLYLKNKERKKNEAARRNSKLRVKKRRRRR